MDTQLFIAIIAVSVFAGFAIGYVAGGGNSRSMTGPSEHGEAPL